MVNLSTLTDLYQHMEWADAAVWTSVLKFEGAPADTKLREYLYHLHLVQRAYLRIWRSEPRDTMYPTFEDAPSLMLWGRSYHTEVFTHLGTLSDGKISERTPVPWATMVERQIGRVPEAPTLGETVLQVALHSLYHRGQVNARLRQIGGEPPLVDYIVWVWLSRPVANWPNVEAPEGPM